MKAGIRRCWYRVRSTTTSELANASSTDVPVPASAESNTQVADLLDSSVVCARTLSVKASSKSMTTGSSS